jgi:hypothetical protein
MTTPNTPPQASPAVPPVRRLRDYGPLQAAQRLQLEPFQIERAVAAGLIPKPNPRTGRWPAAVIDGVAGRVEQIAAAVGTVPHLGAVRAAEVLTARLGVEVSADAVMELHRVGLLDQAGQFRGHPLCDGRQVEAFTDTTALAKAGRDGQLLTRAEAADRLRVRRVDIEHLISAGLLTVAGWGTSEWSNAVPLLRAGDLDTLAVDPRIDWPAVRATRPGRPSPLRALAAAGGTGRSRRKGGAR